MHFCWSGAEVLRKLTRWMTEAFKPVHERAEGEEVSLREAAYLVAVDRVARACRERVESDMNLYTMVGSGIGTPEATALSTRLAGWHDAMVAHERKIRAGRADAMCDEECPHAEARTLWIEALEVFGDRAQELTFLRSRATAAAGSDGKLVTSAAALSEAADRGPRSHGSSRTATTRQSKLFAGSSEESRMATAEL
jgi:hypothetical protein